MKIDPKAFTTAGDPAGAPDAAHAMAAAEAAVRRIAPVWPLDSYVAVNPWLGWSERPFETAAAAVARVAGARSTPSRETFREALERGRIGEDDLAAALAEAKAAGVRGLPADAAALAALLREGGEAPAPAPIPTYADHLSDAVGTDWAAIAVERIATWCAARHDRGQAAWPSPFKELPAYAAWRAEAAHDRTVDALGLRGFRAAVAEAPEDPAEALAWALGVLGVGAAQAETYLTRLLHGVGGWAGHARRLLWQAELQGGTDAEATSLAAIRAVWDAALLKAGPEAVAASWGPVAAAVPSDPAEGADAAALAVDAVLLAAYERGWRKGLFAALETGGSGDRTRPEAQVAFCIDVRSEVMRRALESVAPEVETAGLAGFFGAVMAFSPFGEGRREARCPVLLAPGVEIAAAPAEAAETALADRMRSRAEQAGWWRFRRSAVSAFGFVETLGLGYAGALARRGLGLPVPAPKEDAAPRTAPVLALPLEARVAMAEGVLGAMAPAEGFARLVVLAGHGAHVTNNPHAAGLACGACGGHGGEENARVAAAALNDAEVRAALAAKGVALPEDALFVAARHDTVTDRVEILDVEAVPESHGEALARLVDRLEAASALARAERAGALALSPDGDLAAAMRSRAEDWSQVRPEWGLAGCAAFVAAPRGRTAGLDLGGRVFLHGYDWRRDEGFAGLETILTAPLVVASWISLQYYGSTVDPRAFGAGDKTLHDVVGGIGVREGAGGDLRVGLPLQSVHDGERFVHEPMRLAGIVEAPVEAITEVIRRNPGLKALLDNRWVHLYALDASGRVAFRYAGDLSWTEEGAREAAAA